ncbi:MAG: helix-turn-helix transcriptional regulator [Syntrophorhabdaceae bacterium]|jgi:DNA-binding XRE family transcriptional regulator|nr:helix-turn-helix transcriptional regulator [Syntrophorhabdaceae bacterium]
METYQLFKTARTLQNIKQVHIADKVGIKQQSLVPYESGIAKLSDKNVVEDSAVT